MVFTYRGVMYPDYLKTGNAMQFIEPVARQFCIGNGLDVGCGSWPLPGATPVDLKNGQDACDLPGENWDYIFSSHCLEHLVNPVAALEHWHSKLKQDGILFLYLPHPDMVYWRPENCRKHLHLFRPTDAVNMIRTVGFDEVLRSERDMAWSFTVVGRKAAWIR